MALDGYHSTNMSGWVLENIFLAGIWLFVLLNGTLFADGIEWHEKGDFGIEVVVEIPNSKLRVDESLLVKVSLKYPVGFQPNLDEIRYNLLRTNMFGPVPFYYQDEKRHEAPAKDSFISQEVFFYLDPQAVGKFRLTFFDFIFSSKGKKVVIPSALFPIEILAAEHGNIFQPIYMGLLPFENVKPIDLKPELAQFLAIDDSIKNKFLLKARTIPSIAYFYGFFVAMAIGILLSILGNRQKA